jgi:chemotaxis-related protein WspB
MLFLLFALGADRYALDVRDIVEIIPQVESKILPGAMAGVVGLFNYRGVAIPLLDLVELSLGRACPLKMSTRIIVARCKEESGGSHLVGLLAERVTETLRRNDSDFKALVGRGCGSRFSGAVLTEGNSIIQRVEVEKLIPGSLQAELLDEVAKRSI